MLEKDLK